MKEDSYISRLIKEEQNSTPLKGAFRFLRVSFCIFKDIFQRFWFFIKSHKKYSWETLIVLLEAGGAIFVAISVIPSLLGTKLDNMAPLPLANVVEWKFYLGFRLMLSGYALKLIDVWTKSPGIKTLVLNFKNRKDKKTHNHQQTYS